MKNKKCHRCRTCNRINAGHVVKFDCVEHILCDKCWETFEKWFGRKTGKPESRTGSSRVA